MIQQKVIETLKQVRMKNCITILIGSMILAFGLYNVHSLSGVTEGGVLGLILFLQHWLGLSPAISAPVLNIICYCIGWRVLGGLFIVYSLLANAFFSAFYAVLESMPPIYPQIAQLPLVAAVAGAIFVGVGVGLCVRAGSAPGGDDSLAMSISLATKLDIRWVYLISDIVVLALSLTYIPFMRIFYSLITVVISGQIIGFIQKDTKKE